MQCVVKALTLECQLPTILGWAQIRTATWMAPGGIYLDRPGGCTNQTDQMPLGSYFIAGGARPLRYVLGHSRHDSGDQTLALH